MKRAKLLLSTLAMLVLVVVMAFAISACSGSCNDKDKDNNNNGFVEKNPSDLGINDSSDNTKALQSIAVSGGKSKFALGEDFSKGGLSVTATYIDLTVEVTEDNPNANLKTETLQESDYTVDSAAFNKGKVGTYKINVSYTHAGVTRSASYDAEVGAVEPGYGGILVERNNTDTYTLSAETISKTFGLDDVTVYERSSEDGTVDKAEAQPVAAENLDAKLYLGTQAVENNEAKLDGVYTLVVSLKSDPSKYDFVNFTVANPVKSVEFIGDAEGTLIEQNRNVTDEITSTWNFKLTYVNGVYENVKLADGGFTTDFNPLTSNEETAKQTVTVTYAQTDALGAKHTATCTVANVNVKPNTETLVIEREYIARDDSRYEKDGTIDGALIPGDTILMSTGDKVKFGETTTTYSDGSNFGKQRIQLSDKRLITIMVHGVTKISLYYSSDNNTLKVYGPNDTTTEVFAKQVKRSDNKAEGPVTFVLSTPGLYTIKPTSTTNMHAIYLTTLIPVEGQTIGSYTVKFNENFGTEPTEKEEIVLGFEGFNTPAGYTPERTGYTFEGWFTAAEGGDKVDLSEEVISDNTKTYYAHWSENVVEAIKATKKQTEYLLVNGDVEIKTNDVTVKDSNDKDLSENWSVISKELYSDAECATKVTGNKATALGTYYLKVTAQYKEDTAKQLSSIIEITVSDFDTVTAGTTTISGNLDKTSNKYTLQKSALEAIAYSTSKGTGEKKITGDQLLLTGDSGPWSATYKLTKADGSEITADGSGNYEISEAATYTMTVTLAKSGHANVIVTITVTVSEPSNVATGTATFNEGKSDNSAWAATFGADTSIKTEKTMISDTYVMASLLADNTHTVDLDYASHTGTVSTSANTTAKYYGRMKLNGAGSTTYRSIKFVFTDKVKSAKIIVRAASGNESNERNLGLYTSAANAEFSDTYDDNLVQKIGVQTKNTYTFEIASVTGDRTYYLGSRNSGINLYAITVEYKYESDTVVAQPYVYSFNNHTDIVTDGTELTTGTGNETYTMLDKTTVTEYPYLTSDWIVHTTNKVTKMKYKEGGYSFVYNSQTYTTKNIWQNNSTYSSVYLEFTLAAGSYDVIVFFANTNSTNQGKLAYKVNGASSYTVDDTITPTDQVKSVTISITNGGTVDISSDTKALNFYGIVIVPKAA